MREISKPFPHFPRERVRNKPRLLYQVVSPCNLGGAASKMIEESKNGDCASCVHLKIKIESIHMYFSEGSALCRHWFCSHWLPSAARFLTAFPSHSWRCWDLALNFLQLTYGLCLWAIAHPLIVNPRNRNKTCNETRTCSKQNLKQDTTKDVSWQLVLLLAQRVGTQVICLKVMQNFWHYSNKKKFAGCRSCAGTDVSMTSKSCIFCCLSSSKLLHGSFINTANPTLPCLLWQSFKLCKGTISIWSFLHCT